MSLTAAGEAVLKFSRNVLREEDDLKHRLSDLMQETTGLIRFGASHLRMQACLPSILPVFSQQYPQVELHLTNANSAQLEPKVLDNTLDFAIVLTDRNQTDPFLEETALVWFMLVSAMTKAPRFCA